MLSCICSSLHKDFSFPDESALSGLSWLKFSTVNITDPRGPVAWLQQVEEASDRRKRVADSGRMLLEGCGIKAQVTAVVDCHLKNIQRMCRHAKDAACLPSRQCRNSQQPLSS